MHRETAACRFRGNRSIVAQIHRGTARSSSLGYRGADNSSPLFLPASLSRLPISHPSTSSRRRHRIRPPSRPCLLFPLSPVSFRLPLSVSSLSLFARGRIEAKLLLMLARTADAFHHRCAAMCRLQTRFEPHSHGRTCEPRRARTRSRR